MRTPEDIRCENESLQHFANFYKGVDPMLPGQDMLGYKAEGAIEYERWLQEKGPRLSTTLWKALGGELVNIRADDSEYVPGPSDASQDAPGPDSEGGLQ